MHRPSALPALAKCGSYSSKGDNPYFAPGAARHRILKSLLDSEKSEWDFIVSELDETTQDGVLWAASYIRDSLSGKLIVETKLQWPDPLKPDEMRAGTPDVVAPEICTIVDLKWRDIDCFAQMADYALGCMANFQKPDWNVKVLFAATQRVEEIFFTYKEAKNIVSEILAKVETATVAERNPGGHCSWCKHQLECPTVRGVVANVFEANQEWGIEPGPVEFLVDSKSLGKALRVARVVKDWCEAVEAHVKFMKDQGVLPDGYQIRPRKGDRYITDPAVASQWLGVGQSRVLSKVKISLSAMAELYDEQVKLGKSAANKEMLVKLEAAGLISREQSYDTIVEIKTKPKKGK